MSPDSLHQGHVVRDVIDTDGDHLTQTWVAWAARRAGRRPNAVASNRRDQPGLKPITAIVSLRRGARLLAREATGNEHALVVAEHDVGGGVDPRDVALDAAPELRDAHLDFAGRDAALAEDAAIPCRRVQCRSSWFLALILRCRRSAPRARRANAAGRCR